MEGLFDDGKQSKMSKKTALVTGADRGIGRQIALTLAENEYDVGINYLNLPEEAQLVAEQIRKRGGRAACIRADIRHVHEINQLFERFIAEFGHIDLLVNNAGVTKFTPLLETSEEMWDEIVLTDFKGSYFCTQRAARRMAETQTQGVIINITSVHQQLNFPYASVYGPAKAALDKFTQHAALELAQYGIRVNAIAPGPIKNDAESVFSARQQMFISRTPLKRMGMTSEIADAVLFLASDKARFITGTSLIVDGGARLPALLDNLFTK